MASALTSSTLSKADCDTIVTISGNRALASDASCSLTGTNKDVLVVNLAAALADGGWRLLVRSALQPGLQHV